MSDESDACADGTDQNVVKLRCDGCGYYHLYSSRVRDDEGKLTCPSCEQSGVGATELEDISGLTKSGVTCDSCDWTLTIRDVIEREFEPSRPVLVQDPSEIRRKFTTLGEGHAYFSHGHRISIQLTTEDIGRLLQTETKHSDGGASE